MTAPAYLLNSNTPASQVDTEFDSTGTGTYKLSGPGKVTVAGNTYAPRAIVPAPAGTGTITSVAGAASSTELLAANTSRLGATIYNESTAVLYLALAGSASVTAYTIQIAAGGYYECPFGYVGAIYGIWASATGDARITELSA
jgi:hypothetical protein